MRLPRRHGKTVGSDPNIVALLSLKLLLLAFFILLTAISDFEEEKVVLVVGSINDAFDGQVLAEEDLSPTDAALGPISGSAQLAARVGNLFSSTLPAVRVDRNDILGELRIELTTDSLFRNGEPELQAGPAVLFSRLARALGPERPDAVDARLEVLIGVPRNDLSLIASRPSELALRRAGILARDLARRGVPSADLSVGLLPGLEGRTRLILRASDQPPSSAPEEGS
ncbi:hypothetical protein [Algihabitans albus]|uniref:hypothetical protein n=1 Tax=Algihabitans albus TaxID=2164067 RepID=UPI000E5C5879|nr:hypothetical protein [Algihabitans albus]